MKKLFFLLTFSSMIYTCQAQKSLIHKSQTTTTVYDTTLAKKIQSLYSTIERAGWGQKIIHTDSLLLKQAIEQFPIQDSIYFKAHFLRSSDYSLKNQPIKSIQDIDTCIQWLNLYSQNIHNSIHHKFLSYNFAHLYYLLVLDNDKAVFYLDKLSEVYPYLTKENQEEEELTIIGLKMAYLNGIYKIEEAITLENDIVKLLKKYPVNDYTAPIYSTLSFSYITLARRQKEQGIRFDSTYAKAKYYNDILIKNIDKLTEDSKPNVEFGKFKIMTESSDIALIREGVVGLESLPNDPFYVSNIALGYYKLGQFQTALSVVEANEQRLKKAKSYEGNKLLLENTLIKARILRGIDKKRSLLVYDSCRIQMDAMCRVFTADFAQVALQSTYSTVFNEATSLAYDIHDYPYALTFSDLKKSVGMRNEWYRKQVIQSAERTTDFIIEQALKDSINLYRAERQGAIASFDKERAERAENILFNKEKDFLAWLEDKRKNNEGFYNDRNYSYSPPIDAIQQRLIIDDSSAIIEYLFTPEQSLVFFITKKRFGVKKLPALKVWKNYLDTHVAEMDNSSTPENASFELYKMLLKPVLDELNDSKIYRLAIIADDYFHKIRFDALKTSPVQDNKNYLVNRYCISHPQSLSIYDFQKQSSLKKMGQGFVGLIAHSDTAGDLPSLTKAVLNGSKKWEKDNTVLYNIDKKKFEEVARVGDILALVAHNVKNNKGERGFNLANKDTLTAVNIYADSFRARLIILGNCGSGLGEEFYADGFQSMARAFAYKIPTVLAAKIDDFKDVSYGSIIESFLSHLRNELISFVYKK